MSYHVRFMFSTGLSKPITAPKGSLEKMRNHVSEIEGALNLDGPDDWRFPKFEGVEDKVLCAKAIEHNRWVEWVWYRVKEWSEKPPKGDVETIAPEDMAPFWHALRPINPPIDRWDSEYYRNRMDHLYEVMRGRSDEGVSFDEKALTPKQAGAVIRYFSYYLGDHGLDLEVPKGADQLASSYHGEYDWCEKCGAVWPDDGANCRRSGCPIRKRNREEGWE